MKTLMRTKGDNVWFLTEKGWEWIGQLTSSVGRYGTSSGMFRDCETTTPINEVAEMMGIDELFFESSLNPVPSYF